MTKSEIINALKQCKGNRAALEVAVKVIERSGCDSCKYYDVDLFEFPCEECGCVKPYPLWEAVE